MLTQYKYIYIYILGVFSYKSYNIWFITGPFLSQAMAKNIAHFTVCGVVEFGVDWPLTSRPWVVHCNRIRQENGLLLDFSPKTPQIIRFTVTFRHFLELPNKEMFILKCVWINEGKFSPRYNQQFMDWVFEFCIKSVLLLAIQRECVWDLQAQQIFICMHMKEKIFYGAIPTYWSF